VYKLLKTLTDSDIVVDVISGTSAGGINGILLAYALCNERDISPASALWREDGDIRRLLRSPRDSIAKSTSLLDSAEYYQSRLERAFREKMASYSPEIGEDPSEFSELDLFVTATDVDGHLYTQVDDAGHPIDIKDHRTVFLLKHRKGRKEPFNRKPSYDPSADPEMTYTALATLARITSCFRLHLSPCTSSMCLRAMRLQMQSFSSGASLGKTPVSWMAGCSTTSRSGTHSKRSSRAPLIGP
jgi:hypothetical protein